MYTRRQFLIVTAAGATLRPRAAAAQTWPQRPVRLLVPFAAGGNTDGIARLIGQYLGERLGQQFVVENRAGANGTIAAETVARAPADGYTLFMAALPQIAIAPVMAKVGYDPVRDFAPVCNIGTNPFVLMVNPDFPPRTLAQLVAYAAARPGQLSYASGGTGSLSHLSMILLLRRAGLTMTHVPYKGGGPATADVIADHVPMYFANISEALPQVHAGTLRALAISSEARSPQLPDVPTVSESGFPGFRTITWNGLLAPAGTPRDIIATLAAATRAGIDTPALRERLQAFGIDPLGAGPEAFAATIAADIPLWAEAVRLAGAAAGTP